MSVLEKIKSTMNRIFHPRMSERLGVRLDKVKEAEITAEIKADLELKRDHVRSEILDVLGNCEVLFELGAARGTQTDSVYEFSTNTNYEAIKKYMQKVLEEANKNDIKAIALFAPQVPKLAAEQLTCARAMRDALLDNYENLQSFKKIVIILNPAETVQSDPSLRIDEIENIYKKVFGQNKKTQVQST